MEYFTPTIEDIHSGYEYEVKRFNGDWEKVTEFSNDYDYEDNPHYAIMKDIKAGKIRVPYLTKEQIENEGWKFTREYLNKLSFETKDIWNEKVKGGFLSYNTETKILTINLKNGETTIDGPKLIPRFNGVCKSINDLRYIQKKLLNIE